VFSSSLRRHEYVSSFEQFKQTLLYAFAAHVAGDRRVVTLPGNLVNFVDVNDATLGCRYVVITNL
jgi:hypothetical protein